MDVKPEASCPISLSELRLNCTTCAQIIDFYTNGKEQASVVLGSASSLIDTECAHREWFKSLVPDSLEVEGPIELSLLKVGSSIQLRAKGQNYWYPTSLHELVYRKCTGRGWGRVLDPSWIDEGVILEWKDLCSKSHGDACENPGRLERVDPVQPTWLIDTVDGRLVPGRLELRYVALSYVRGGAALVHHERGNTDELQNPGVLLQGDLAKRLPATIQDAIAIVPLLGERFLWIDSLCIVHDDEASSQIELAAMSRIYRSSYLTVVAADGVDATHGLRGFRGLTSPRKLQQTIVPLADSEMLIAPLKHRESNKIPSVYQSRAWTYQEYLFAKRRILFEHGQIFWECDRCHWDEELVPDLSSSGTTGHSEYQLKPFRSKVLNMTSLGSLVSDFNQKALTFAHDAISAFSGMQWILGQTFPGGLLYGIPEFFFEAGLMWVPQGVVERRRSTTRPLFASQLPSWSFLGWQGAVNFPADGEFYEYPNPQADFMIGMSRPVTSWYAMSHPESSERRQINSDWHAYKFQGRKLAKELPETSPYYPFPPDSANPPYGSTGHTKEMEIKMQKFHDLSAQIPEGWALVELGASGAQDGPADTQDYRTAECPLEFAYQYKNPIDQTYYRYPVPVHHEATQYALPPQTQFLSCKTSRAFWRGVLKPPTKESSTISGLYLEGKNIGFVTLMSQSIESKCAKPMIPEDAVCELIAISEGWACWSDEANKDFETENWSESDRRECYHVLCIGWEEEIAYRRGVGCVLKETWEDIREKELVDLVLG